MDRKEVRSGCKKHRRTTAESLQWGLLVCAALVLVGCGGSDDAPPVDAQAQDTVATVQVPYTNGAAAASNPVAYWNKIGSDTVNAPATPGTGTPEEQRPAVQIELATLHTAIYDAVMAIVGTHAQFAVTPSATNGDGASQEAAVGAAAYGVLKGLFPNRSALYQHAYDDFVAAIPDGDAKARGLAIGAEAATGTLALRANDGRATPMTYASRTEPGKFRAGPNPIGTFLPFIKPFTLDSPAQFRAPPPPALDSAEYAADFMEVMALGGRTSTERTAEQLEIARTHSEAPGTLTTRNYRAFAIDGKSIADNARVMAMLWVAQADAVIACFETKYFYELWRPQTAIPMADADGNDATVADAAWTPSVPSPNHPEYPSAHLCVHGAAAVVMKKFFGTPIIGYSFGNTVTGTARAYRGPDDFLSETTEARIWGGMHFRNSNVRGRELGSKVGEWVAARFGPRG